jgi:hypothetical protein
MNPMVVKYEPKARDERHLLLQNCACCADEKPSARIIDCARMKSASVRNRRSWIKANLSALVFIHNRVFCADALFIRTENAVGARERARPFLACKGA